MPYLSTTTPVSANKATPLAPSSSFFPFTAAFAALLGLLASAVEADGDSTPVRAGALDRDGWLGADEKAWNSVTEAFMALDHLPVMPGEDQRLRAKAKLIHSRMQVETTAELQVVRSIAKRFGAALACSGQSPTATRSSALLGQGYILLGVIDRLALFQPAGEDPHASDPLVSL